MSQYVEHITKGDLIFSNDIYQADEEYKNTPSIKWVYQIYQTGNFAYSKEISESVQSLNGWFAYSYRAGISIEDILSTTRIRIYTKPDKSSYSVVYTQQGQSRDSWDAVSYTNVGNASYLPLYAHPWTDQYTQNINLWKLETNIPVFHTDAELVTYLTDGTNFKDAINYKSPETSPDGEWFTVNNVWTVGIWLNDNQPPVSEMHYRNFRAKMTGGKFALYPISGIDDNKLKMGIKNEAEFYDMQYCTDGTNWVDTDEFPFEFFYRRRINELSPTPDTYIGYALSFSNSKIPEFPDEQTAQDYLDDLVDITQATNWSEISNNYPAGSNIGDALETATEFGHVFTRAMFSQLYLCNISALEVISNNLFDYDVTTLSGIWEDIKKGLEMYGTDPMQVVQSLRYYPFDISQYFTSISPQSYIYFGAYQLTLQNNSVYKVIYPDGYIDLGTTKIDRWYDNWKDFEPYTKLSVYLPYVGMYPLDAKKYYGKSVLIRYFIDLRTGACTACLIANDVLIDYFDGIIGTEMPITLTDYSSYAQSQLNIIMRNAGLGIASEATAGNLASKVMGSALTYNENAQAIQEAAQMSPLKSSLAAQTAGSYGAQAIGAAAVGGTALLGGVAVGTAMKTSFDLMRNGTAGHTKTKPASSAMINQYLPQYPFFRLEIMDVDESEWLNDLYGRPSNKSDYLCNFSGYLECEDVSLICPIATDNERQEIIDLLKSGIYLTPP